MRERRRATNLHRMSPAPEQLLVFEFGPDAAFEGQLVGALERLESGGTLRVRAVLFAHRLPETGEFAALERRHAAGSSITAPLLEFRLDEGARRRETARALDGPLGDTLREIGGRLEPGGALAAVVIEHRWAEVLTEAAGRTGGSLVTDADGLARELLG